MILKFIDRCKASFLQPLRPSQNSFDAHKREKIYNHNLFTLALLIQLLLIHFTLFVLFSNYSLSLLLFILSYHLFMIYTIYLDPSYQKFFLPVASIYFVIAGPIAVKLSNGLQGLMIAFSGTFPPLSLFFFRNRMVSVLILFIEIFKFYCVYPYLVVDTIQKIPFDLLTESIFEECRMLAFVLTPIFLFFYNYYYNFNKNEQAQNKSIERLEAKVKELETDLDEKDVFIMSFSHEIRNPLNALLGNIELAHEEALSPHMREKLRTAKICGELLLSMMNNILDVSKAQLGKMEISIKETHLITFLDKIWSTSKELIKSKGLSAAVQISTKLPRIVKIDQYRLTQVLFNLIGNAIKFTQKGNITLNISWLPKSNKQGPSSIRASINEPGNHEFSMDESAHYVADEETNVHDKILRTPKLETHIKIKDKNVITIPVGDAFFKDVELFDAEQDGLLQIEVIDSGTGIGEEDQHQLFERNKQFSKRAEHRRGGTGLGLWITKAICEKMNGKLTVTSKLGVGSKFIVQIATSSAMTRPQNNRVLTQSPHNKESSVKALIVATATPIAKALTEIHEKCKLKDVQVSEMDQTWQKYEKSLEQKDPFRIITMALEHSFTEHKKVIHNIRRLENMYNVPPASIIVVCDMNQQREFFNLLELEGLCKKNHLVILSSDRDDFDEMLERNISQSVRRITRNSLEVLIADDDRFNQKMLEELLGKLGVSCQVASNGLEALNMYKQNPDRIKIIFMDCEMSEMDGWTSSGKILEFCHEYGIPEPEIYGLTGHSGEFIQEKCAKAGMKSMIKKPISFKELTETIDSYSS